MSKRNSHAAKAARRAARSGPPPLPAAGIRAAIADAVDKAVRDLHATYPDYDQSGLGACALYAFAGSVVASVVTGREYVAQVGALSVRTGPKDEDGMCDWLQMDPAVTGYNGMEFHAWFARKPDGARPGDLFTTPADIEIADLSFRHYPAMAQAHAGGWDRGDWPDWFWDRAERLRGLGVTLRPDTRAYDMVFGDAGTRRIGEAVARVALDYYHGRTPKLPWQAIDAESLAAWEAARS